MSNRPLLTEVQKLRRELRESRLSCIEVLAKVRAERDHAAAVEKTDKAIAVINARIRASNAKTIKK